jgi:hypothetical protein
MAAFLVLRRMGFLLCNPIDRPAMRRAIVGNVERSPDPEVCSEVTNRAEVARDIVERF